MLLHIYSLPDQTCLRVLIPPPPLSHIHSRKVIDCFLTAECVGPSSTEVLVRGARTPCGLGGQWVWHPVSNRHTERDPKRSGSEPAAAPQLPRAQILCRRHHTLQTDRPGPTWAQTGELSCMLSVCVEFCFLLRTWLLLFLKVRILWLVFRIEFKIDDSVLKMLWKWINKFTVTRAQLRKWM